MKPRPIAKRLEGVDVPLLTSLELLLETRNVTAAAKKLRVSQSAMSHTLRRLRELLEDPLLVRGARGMVLTPRAQALLAPLRDCLREVSRVFEPTPPFEAATTRQHFRISATDFLALRLAPGLATIAQREAPGALLSIHSVPAQSYREQLERGELDLMIGGALLPKPDSLMCRELGKEPMACAVRRGHPRIRGKLTLEQYLREHHLLVTPEQRDRRGIVDVLLDQLGERRHVAMCVASFLVAPHVLASTDLLLTAPLALLELYARPLELVLAPPPLEIEAFAVHQLWHSRSHVDPAQRWLREAVARSWVNPTGD